MRGGGLFRRPLVVREDERGREEDTCEKTCEGHECMGQTHTIQVLYYMPLSANSLALTFGNFLNQWHCIHVI